MLDKSKIYRIYGGAHIPHKNQGPQNRFRRVRILFEDTISFYVESLIDSDIDSRGFPKRYSIKKHCFYVEEIIPKKIYVIPDLHFGGGHCVPCYGKQICPICAVLGDSVIEKRYESSAGIEFYDLITRADLAIVNGRVVRNRYGPVGREADRGDYERADLIITDGRLVRDRLPGIQLV